MNTDMMNINHTQNVVENDSTIKNPAPDVKSE